MSVDRQQSILMFHGVGEPPAHLPADEIPYWVTNEAFDAIVQSMRARTGEPEIIWTFDDGNASDVAAAETLGAAGLKGKFYVLTGRIGQVGYLSANDLRTIDSMGMEVGLHGRDHVDWRRADDATLEAEIAGARKELSDIMGKPVTSLAIPFGMYDRRVIGTLMRSDFTRIYTSDTGPARRRDRFARRNPVMSHHRAADVATIVDDRVALARRIRRGLMPFVKRTFR